LLESLAEFYPKHIEKEDRHFFIPVMKYFSEEEQKVMLQEEYTFDQKFIHQLYKEVVTKVEEVYSSAEK
jgi:hemerythrin-like domain-containing protein